MFEIKDHILIRYHAPITEEEREAMRRAEEEAEAKKHVKHTAASAWDLGTESGPTAWGMRKRDAEEKIDQDSILVEDGDPEGRIVVLPEYRHQGIGTRVVREAETWARELGYAIAVVESRDNKIPFYESMDYVADFDRKIEGETFTCFRMEKNLDSGR